MYSSTRNQDHQRFGWLRPIVLPAVLALGVLVLTGFYLDRQNTVLSEQRMRTAVLAEASLVRAKLEGNINANLQLVRGLVAMIASSPDIEDAGYVALAGRLFEEHSQLRSIAIAPDLVVRMTYPLKGNERAIGLDYRDNDAQRDAVLRARDTEKLVLAGPVDLVQGGRGFVGRFPVFVDGPNGSRQFWGVVSAVVDVDRLYADSGLLDPDLGIDVSITGRDAKGGAGERFFGPDLAAESPVLATVVLPTGSWEIAAVPKGGWDTAQADSWRLRLVMAGAGALILLPLVITGRLIGERQQHFRELTAREAELAARNVELEAARTRIEHNALHDSLTGLPNRRYLDDMLRRHASGGYRGSGSLALLHIDLDRFKQINDTLGHAAGDAMLIHAGRVLRASCRDTDFVARVGGDEFVVLCGADEGDGFLAGLAEAIVCQMRRPVGYEGHECRFGVSIGIATERGPMIDAKRLLINADIALYRAKGRGRNRFEFFSDVLQAEVVRTKRVADEILNGLERNEFVAYYQPQFDARSLDLVGVEALARWQHPVEGIKAPDSFLPIAEDLNVVATIDRLILDQTLSALERWDRLGLAVPRASVNVSLRRLNDQDLIAGLRQLDIAPGRIAFELVESIYLDENDEVVGWNIDRLKELGIDIEIDDFGTGYASIVSLQKLRPARLKIDRQLVHPITVDPAQRRLLASIVDIGKAMGIEVVAEGVETMAHARMLRDIGVDILQGYAFSRPLSAEALEAFIAAQAWRSAS